MARQKVGGSFAPPLTDEILDAYKALIEAQPESAIKDALKRLLQCILHWWDLPESNGLGVMHATGVATIIPLNEEIAAELWDDIPWAEELEQMKGMFNAIPTPAQRELRNCAFHLLWFAIELEKDREPITNDTLNL